MQASQRVARLQSQVVAQRPSRCLVRGERVRLAAAAVERQHLRLAVVLPVWMERHQGVELRDERPVPAELQVGVDPLVERDQARLLQVRELGVRNAVVGQVGQGRAAPEGERLAEQRRGGLGAGAGRACAELLEAPEVELAVLDAQRVAAAVRGDAIAAEGGT